MFQKVLRSFLKRKILKRVSHLKNQRQVEIKRNKMKKNNKKKKMIK